jgi:RNA polymerase sigma-70 factor, ECF subfamily
MEMTEAQVLGLLKRVADRSPKAISERAIEALYLEFSRPIHNYIWKNFSQEPTLIEEVIQDTFLEVWKHPERFRGESQFKTWLLGIARHKALDCLRKRSKSHDPLEDYEDELVSPEITVLELIHKEQIQKALTYCLENLTASGKLSAEHKEVLHLTYVEDQDINELATIVDCIASTIKTRLHYARLRIKKCLEMRLSGGIGHG